MLNLRSKHQMSAFTKDVVNLHLLVESAQSYDKRKYVKI